MDKSKFKKLASMGMAAGILLASEVPASANAFEGTILAACGGRSAPSNNGYSNQPTYSSCSSRSQPSQGCASRSQSQMTAERDLGQPNQMNPYNQQMNPNTNTNPNAQQMDPSMNSNIDQRNINPNSNSQINPNTQQKTPGYSAGCGAHRSNNQPSQNYSSCSSRSQPNDMNSNRSNNMTADASTDTKAQPTGMQTTTAKPLTESELFSQLTAESKAQYQNLDPQGKAMALKLASQFQDKNQAVRVASQRMTERRTLNSSGQKFVAPGSAN